MGQYIRLLLVGCCIACLLVPSACASTPEAEAQWKISYDLMVAGKCLPALDASEKAIALDPQFGKPWNIKGSALHCLGRNEEALEAFEKAIALDPTLEVAKKNIAHVQLALTNGAPVTISPEAEAQWETAYDLMDEGKCSSALDAGEKAIELDPQLGKAWNIKGSALHCLGRNDEALEAFEKAIALDPTLEVARKNIDHVHVDLANGAPLTVLPEAGAQWETAYNLMAEGKCSSALVASGKAIALDPQFGMSWNVKGSALHCLGRNEEALEAFEKAIACDPTLEIARKNIDHVHVDLANGAPLTTAPVILPVVSNTSIRYDGELKYDPTGELTGCWAYLKKGHAVFYSNNRTIIVTGVRVAGCHYGNNDGYVRIEIWDKNLTTLYRDVIPYEKIPFTTILPGQACGRNSSWVDISLPDHEVTGDFYIAIYTDSSPISENEHGIYIVFYTPSETGTSYTVLTNPDRLDNSTIGKQNYKAGEFDWMIHVLYTNPPAPAEAISSPGISGTGAAGSGQAPLAPASGPTKSPVEGGLVITGLVSGVLYRRIRR